MKTVTEKAATGELGKSAKKRGAGKEMGSKAVETIFEASAVFQFERVRPDGGGEELAGGRAVRAPNVEVVVQEAVDP